ncbi:ankyrin repeat and KH domain-containing protein 1 isoform X2 [Nematostella vectensis]|uniref:ankyrin repeat and KH domain-containing protein 1 isoform X2 n=1 Tax=Nematostella vectensis TaxID=45351 RepID=UPI0020776C2D|nr:ankyrin repeat and KH domain-containing protein 1 isoform X2 [Nematostella vectensis]
MSSEEDENVDSIETTPIDESDSVVRSVAEADVSLDEMMSLACRQGKLDIVELLLESGAHVDYRNKAGNTPLLEACSQGHVDVARYLLDHSANIDAPTETTSDSALTWACTLGNEAIVKLLLQRKANVEHRTKDGCTALMFAALAGHVKVATMLLDHGAEINVESDSNKDSPLTFACWKGHCDVVELLLARSANIEHRTKEGFTPLMFAALGGHTDVAAKLLEQGAKVNIPSGSNNDIPLTSACWKGHHDVVKLLLKYTSNIEHRTKDGCTPLMLAAREGHYSVAKLILDSKAEVNKPSGSENNIPLTLACWKGHTKVVELLLEHKSNIEHRNKAGCTPLMLAAREGHVETTELLLNKGAEINKPSGSNDDTPLTLACWKGHVGVVELLLKHHSKVDHQTKTGCTPLMEATREGHVDVAEQLLNHGADVELPDNYGQSPLFMACWKGHQAVAELLLEHSASRDCRTKTGITPLFQACRENHVEVVRLLLDCGASVNAPFPNSRENPLTLAAEKGHAELVSLLLRRNANVECHTKKGCTPFHLSCKEGHLAISIALHIRGADTEAVDSRNNSPLVAAMKNGHTESTEWLLNVVNHLPSEEQCQKCLVAPIEDKDRHEEVMLGRTKCYDLVTKAKKAKEQKVQRNTEIFLKELETEKEREDNRKKKAAAKRRDKRKRRKAAKENEGSNVKEDLPLENRPQEVAENESEGDGSEGSDEYATQTQAQILRECQNELVQETKNIQKKKTESPYKQDLNHLDSSKLDERSLGRNKIDIDVEELSKNLVGSNDRQHQQHVDPVDYVDRKSESSKSKVTKKRSEDGLEVKEIKKKSSSPQSAQKGKKNETDAKSFSPAHLTVNVTETKSDKTGAKKEGNTLSSSVTSSSSTQNNGLLSLSSTCDNSTPHKPPESPTELSTMPQPVSPRERGKAHHSPKSSPEDGEKTGRRGKEGDSQEGGKHSKGRIVSKGSTTSGQSITVKTSPAEADKDLKPAHSPRSKQHTMVIKTEEHWKEVTRTPTNAKTMVVQLTAPNALCGRVIGRGGSKINSITEESGAQITIGKPEPKNPTDRVITIKGSNKSVQRAKFLVTTALNTPSTVGQPSLTTPTTTATTATSFNTSDSSNTLSAPVRGNYAAIASNTSSSEWPTIMQANTMSTGQVSIKPTVKTVLSEPSRRSPEDIMAEARSENQTHTRSLSSSSSENSFSFKVTKSTSPITVTKATPAWSSSAWKPNRPPVTQSIGMSTSAVTTCTSSCRTTIETSATSGVAVMCEEGMRFGASVRGYQDQEDALPQAAVIQDGVPSHPLAPFTSESNPRPETKVPITTIGASTSAEVTTSQRDLMPSPSQAHVTATAHYGAIGSNKPVPTPHETTSASYVSSFGAIGQTVNMSTMLKESAPEFTPGKMKESLLGDPQISQESSCEPLGSPPAAPSTKFPCYSPWSTKSAGIGRDNAFSGSDSKFQGPLPGMELFTGANSLFSGSLPSYPWSTGEDEDRMDRGRSISWTGQAEYQDSRLGSVTSTSASPPGKKQEGSLLQGEAAKGDSNSFKPLATSSIWGQMGPQGHPGSSLSVTCDEETPEKQAWNNSDSTSSSRSSSRQELSSIMDADSATNSGVWNSCAFADDITPTPQTGSGPLSMPHPSQAMNVNTQWSSNRGAYSAPSSPSQPRSQSQPEPGSESVGLQPSMDDSAVQWNSKEKSPRSHSSSDQTSGWNSGSQQAPRRSSIDLSQSYQMEGGGVPSGPWQYPSRQQEVCSAGFGVREPWREPPSTLGSGFDVPMILKRLTLEKYLPVFEENNINGGRLAQMTEADLERLGIPKGPRLKLLHAIRSSHSSHGTRLATWPTTMNSNYNNPDNGLIPPNSAPHTSKKPPPKPEPSVMGKHNHVASNQMNAGIPPQIPAQVHKKVLTKQPFDHQALQPPLQANHVNQPLLSMMSPARGGAPPQQHPTLLGTQEQHLGGLPSRPHSASGNLTNHQVFPANSIAPGDQQFPFPGQQGHYVNQVSYSHSQVYYPPGGYYYFYQQQ